MGGFSQITGNGLGSVMNADNVSFDGTEQGGVVTTNGQLLIGSTATPHIRVGNITSNGGTVLVTNGAGTINIETTPSQVQNLGITYSAGTGTFTITSSNGLPLSASNPGYVTLSSKTSGLNKTVAITADQSFIDDNGSSQIIGNLFGLTTGVAFTQDMLFFIYAVLDDTETNIAFMISRLPNAKTSPAAARIGKSGSAVADTQGSFFSLANITVADYESNPCVSIGSFRMRMSASDDWTVQTLSFNDGIGRFNENTALRLSTGQFGAASGKYFKDNGGTAPSFSTNNFMWNVDQNNRMNLFADLSNSTAGVGAVTLTFALPFNLNAAIGSIWQNDGTGGLYVGTTRAVSGPTNNLTFYITIGGAAVALLNNNSIGTTAARQFVFSVSGWIDAT